MDGLRAIDGTRAVHGPCVAHAPGRAPADPVMTTARCRLLAVGPRTRGAFFNKTPIQLNLKLDQNKFTKNYFFNESYFLEVFSNQDFKTNLFKISKSDFFKNKVDESELYGRSIEDSINLSTLFIIITSIILILFVFDRYRFNKIILSRHGIIYKRVFNRLDKKEIDVIIELINNDVVATKSILNIVENPNLSYPHNIKIKDQFLRELNLKLSTIFNTSYNPIIVRKSKTDARIKEYCFMDAFNRIVKRFSINVY